MNKKYIKEIAYIIEYLGIASLLLVIYMKKFGPKSFNFLGVRAPMSYVAYYVAAILSYSLLYYVLKCKKTEWEMAVLPFGVMGIVYARIILGSSYVDIYNIAVLVGALAILIYILIQLGKALVTNESLQVGVMIKKVVKSSALIVAYTAAFMCIVTMACIHLQFDRWLKDTFFPHERPVYVDVDINDLHPWGDEDSKNSESLIDILSPKKDMLDAYTECVQKQAKLCGNRLKYTLVYINDDDIPELVLADNSSHIGMCSVYTFCNHQLKFVGSYGEFGRFEYVERGNLIHGFYAGMGVASDYFYEINENGREVELDTFRSEPEDFFSDIMHYFRDNVEVTKEEYDAGMALYDKEMVLVEYDKNMLKGKQDLNIYSMMEEKYAEISH